MTAAGPAERRLSQAELQRALAGAREAVERAVALVQQMLASPFGAFRKSDRSPVTEIDLAVDRLLFELLPAVLPAAWLSEETADDPIRLDSRLVWVVDPIDGTRSLLAGTGQFCVSVALCEGGAPVVAVVANPTSDERFYAARGAGAHDQDGRPMRVRQPVDGDLPALLVSTTEVERGMWRGLEGDVAVTPLSSLAYKLAKVARGDVDATMTPWARSEWDAAAGDLLVREAGGESVDIHGLPLRYNRRVPTFEGVVAGAPALLGRFGGLRAELASRRRAVQARQATSGRDSDGS